MGATSAGRDDSRDDHGWPSRRRAELDRRIREIHERNTELSDRIRGAGTGEQPDDRRGSSQEQVTRAETLARIATDRAEAASRRAAMMFLHSAAAHERVAQTHLRLADSSDAEGADHRERAAWHVRQAAADRAAAEQMFRSIRSGKQGAGQE